MIVVMQLLDKVMDNIAQSKISVFSMIWALSHEHFQGQKFYYVWCKLGATYATIAGLLEFYTK